MDTIILLAGGWSGEREVSLNSGGQCAEALEGTGAEVLVLDPARELDRLFELAPKAKAVLPLLHGTFGEDGRIQGLLDCLGVPYPGTGVAQSVISMNKVLTKDVFRRAGIQVAPDVVIRPGSEPDLDRLAKLGLPVVVKPAREGSSLGATVVDRAEDLGPALEAARRYDPLILVEKGLIGRELTAAVLDLPGQGLTALPVIEIRPRDARFFDYRAKYTFGATDEICPAPLEPEVTARVQALGLAAHRALELEHWSRTDMFLVGDELFVLESNTIPGMAETSLFPKAAAAAGMDLGEVLNRLVDLALRDRPRK